jgi:3-oxoacyl-[acyl-carrier-protein] synthase-3
MAGDAYRGAARICKPDACADVPTSSATGPVERPEAPLYSSSVATELRSRVLASGAAIAATRVGSDEIERRLSLAPGWIRTRTGVEARHVLRGTETLLDLAEQASRRALEAAGVTAAEVDGIVVATASSEYAFPSLACLLQARLGSDGPFAFDVAAACAGFVYGLGVVDAMLRAGSARTLLLVGADALATMVGRDDPICAPLFGDAAGAVVVRAEPGTAGVLKVILRARGAQADLLELPAGGPFDTGDAPRPADRCMRMKGPELFRAAVTELLAVTRDLLREIGLGVDDVALLIPHQANARIIAAMVEHLGLAPERVLANLDRYGNTSAASVPVALDEAWRRGRLRSGDVVVLNAVGGGLAWGAAALRI